MVRSSAVSPALSAAPPSMHGPTHGQDFALLGLFHKLFALQHRADMAMNKMARLAEASQQVGGCGLDVSSTSDTQEAKS